VINQEGYWANRHPIRCIDGWYYLCYWNESEAYLTWEVPSYPGDPQAPRIHWYPLLISTGVKIGDPLPHRTFTFTQLNGRTFKTKLKGSIENPVWETTSGKLIIQEPTEIDGECKGVWYYAEYNSYNCIQPTGIPVNEHDPKKDNEINSSSIPGFEISLLLLILPFIYMINRKKN
jgi:hypothetical protein